MKERKKDGLVFYISHYQAVCDLTNEQLGRLFRALFEKQIGNEVVLENDIKIAFNFINNQLVVDEKKYNARCEIARENGKKGGAPKGNKNALKQPKQPKQPKTTLKEKEKENENENENENVEIDIESASENKSEKSPKHKYGEYKNVLLSDKELEKLKNEYSNYQELIKCLDEYIEMKGYKAKSHYLAIKKWVVDAVRKRPKDNVKRVQGMEYSEDYYNKFY